MFGIYWKLLNQKHVHFVKLQIAVSNPEGKASKTTGTSHFGISSYQNNTALVPAKVIAWKTKVPHGLGGLVSNIPTEFVKRIWDGDGGV